VPLYPIGRAVLRSNQSGHEQTTRRYATARGSSTWIIQSTQQTAAQPAEVIANIDVTAVMPINCRPPSTIDFEGIGMKKTTVEDCLVLNVNMLTYRVALGRRNERRRMISLNGGTIINVGVNSASASSDELAIRLQYYCSDGIIEYDVAVLTTPCFFGGHRLWFSCPGERCDGGACMTRVAKLYKPHDSRYFLCRHCHNLSYRSRQEWQSQSPISLVIQLFELRDEMEEVGFDKPIPKRLDNRVTKLMEAAKTKGLI
jgi:hypothetical protein